MPESLTDQFISDFYTSLLHLDGTDLNRVFDGAGNSTGLMLSGGRVTINNYIYPEGPTEPTEWLDAFFPVGCVQLTLDDINPQTRIAGTVWQRIAEGQFLVGVGELVAVCEGVLVCVADLVGVLVLVFVGVTSLVAVCVAVLVGVRVFVLVGVTSLVEVCVAVLVGVTVLVLVGVTSLVEV